jgi:hypothetical protein
MKFDEYFSLYMRMKPVEKRVADSLPERYFALSKKKFMEEVRKRAYGTLYPRKSTIGRRITRTRVRRAMSRPASRRQPVNFMNL